MIFFYCCLRYHKAECIHSYARTVCTLSIPLQGPVAADTKIGGGGEREKNKIIGIGIRIHPQQATRLGNKEDCKKGSSLAIAVVNILRVARPTPEGTVSRFIFAVQCRAVQGEAVGLISLRGCWNPNCGWTNCGWNHLSL